MFGVYASDVETLREVLDRPYKLLGTPFCGHLIYLARSVDQSALDFLDKFGAAIDHETGESLAFIVLLDDATLTYSRHYSDKDKVAISRSSYDSHYYGWPDYRRDLRGRSGYGDSPLFDVPELVDGQIMFENAIAWRIKGSTVPKAASYRSSPEWSLKFADHLGLNRNYLPCIVGFDDPESSGDDSCVIIPLQDPVAAWDCIVNAISNFVMRPETQAFIHASEQFRKVDKDLRSASYRITLIEDELARLPSSGNQRSMAAEADRRSSAEVARWEGLMPSRQKCLRWIDSLSNDRRSFLTEVVLIAQDDGEDVTPLLNMLASPAEIRTTRQYFLAVHQLRTLWLQGGRFQDNPHITVKIHEQLATALRWLERPVGDIDRVLVMEATEREAFIDTLEANAPFQQSDVQLAWTILTQTLRPYIKKAVVDRKIKELQAETDMKIKGLQTEIIFARQRVSYLSDRRQSAMVELNSTKRSPFLPDLAQSVEQMMRFERTPARTVSSARTRIVKGATITAESTGFIASIVQILQGIGVLR